MKKKHAVTRRLTAIATALVLLFIPTLRVAAEYTPSFNLTSEGIYLVNTDSDTVIYSKNANERMAPASLTKIMTAIVIMENVEDLDAVTATAEQWMFDEFYGLNISNAGIVAGETMTMRQLLYCMLLQSANEAAVVAAYEVGNQSVDHFIDMMNETAQRIGATDTHFVNPHGLDADDHYTTPHDMYVIARYASELPGFMNIVSTTVYYLEATNMTDVRTLVNTNRLMSSSLSDGYYYYAPVSGIKTGTTPDAGYCVVTTASQNGMNYLCVCIGSPYYDENGQVNEYNGAFLDTRELYKWVFSTFSVKELLSKGDPVDEIELNLAWEKDYLLLVPEESFSALVPNDISADSVQRVVKLPEGGVDAPIEKGQVIGSMKLILAGEQIGEVNLIAAESVERSQLLFFLDELKTFFTSAPFWLCFGAFILAIISYVIYMIIRNKRVLGSIKYRRQKPGLPKR